MKLVSFFLITNNGAGASENHHSAFINLSPVVRSEAKTKWDHHFLIVSSKP